MILTAGGIPGRFLYVINQADNSPKTIAPAIKTTPTVVFLLT